MKVQIASWRQCFVKYNIKEFDLYIRIDWKRIKVETVGKRQKGGVKYWKKDYVGYYGEKGCEKE